MKDILLSVFSGIAGIILTICYQHFFTSPSQFITLNYQGEQMELDSSEFMKIIQEKEDLHLQLQELEKTYSEEIEAANIKIDELEKIIQTVPTEVIKNNTENKLSFTKVCEPYEQYSNAFFDIRSVKCQGIEYSNCIYLNSLGNSNCVGAKYNLLNQYTKLSFLLGKVDKSGDSNGIINFYVDNILVRTINPQSDDDLTEYEISLGNGKILEIEYTTGHTGYAIINAVIE